MIKQKLENCSGMIFKTILILRSIAIYQNIFIPTVNATTEVFLDEPMDTLTSKGIKNITFCKIHPRGDLNVYVPFFYKGILEDNGRNSNVCVYIMPKIYTQARIDATVFFQNDSLGSNDVFLKYKANHFLNLKPINHRSIIPILKTYESENFYYCVQELFNENERNINIENVRIISVWVAKKLILLYCYGLKALTDNNIIIGKYGSSVPACNENYNIRFNQLITILSSFKSYGESYDTIEYSENICLDLYDFSNAPPGTYENIKSHSVLNELKRLCFFCKEILMKTVFCFANEEKEKEYLASFSFYKSFLEINQSEALNYTDFIFNDECLKDNIISIPDFRKFTDENGETPNYLFFKEENKLKVITKNNEDSKIEYEFMYIETSHPIQLKNGNIHYRDFELIKNKELIDFDELNEESFLTLKKEIEYLVLEVEMYNCKNAKFRLSNEVLDLFLFKDPKIRYSFIFKSNLTEENGFLFIKVVDGELKIEGLEKSLAESKLCEYNDGIKEFIRIIEYLFDEEEYNEWAETNIDSNEDIKNYLFQPTFFYIPGLGTRREMQEDTIYKVQSNDLELWIGDIIYDLTRCGLKVLFRNNEFYEMKIDDEGSLKLIKLANGESKKDKVLKEVDHLLSGSLISIS